MLRMGRMSYSVVLYALASLVCTSHPPQKRKKASIAYLHRRQRRRRYRTQQKSALELVRSSNALFTEQSRSAGDKIQKSFRGHFSRRRENRAPGRVRLCGPCVLGHVSRCFIVVTSFFALTADNSANTEVAILLLKKKQLYVVLRHSTPFLCLGFYSRRQITFASTLRSTSCSHSLHITRRHAVISCLRLLHHRCSRASCTCA